jgi:hypothetical protein
VVWNDSIEVLPCPGLPTAWMPSHSMHGRCAKQPKRGGEWKWEAREHKKQCKSSKTGDTYKSHLLSCPEDRTSISSSVFSRSSYMPSALPLLCARSPETYLQHQPSLPFITGWHSSKEEKYGYMMWLEVSWPGSMKLATMLLCILVHMLQVAC